MKTNSINSNGCSVCEKGKEKYIKCVLGAFLGKIYYQYDYRHTDGELFYEKYNIMESHRKIGFTNQVYAFLLYTLTFHNISIFKGSLTNHVNYCQFPNGRIFRYWERHQYMLFGVLHALPYHRLLHKYLWFE